MRRADLRLIAIAALALLAGPGCRAHGPRRGTPAAADAGSGVFDGGEGDKDGAGSAMADCGCAGPGQPALADGGSPADATPAGDGGTAAAGDQDAAGGQDLDGSYSLATPADFPRPMVPEDDPLSQAKVELGRRLFYDRRLSGNGTQACASCHVQARAFTDGHATSVGSTGQHTHRSAMSLANVAYASALTWANPALRTLERQALVPMFGEDPVELGLSGLEATLLARLSAEPVYAQLFPRAFPGDGAAVTLDHVVKALASFERTLISGDSPYDRFARGAEDALSASARRGMDLFFSERCECFHCHGGFAFTQSVHFVGSTFDELEFHNTGLYNLDGAGAYPPGDTGLAAVTGDPRDMGRFRAPSLRNVAVTAPYMHDGSIATLSEVIDHYARGGRKIDQGPYRGDGRESPLKSDLITGFTISPEEKADLIEFLESLTDPKFLADPAFSDPWPDPPPILPGG